MLVKQKALLIETKLTVSRVQQFSALKAHDEKAIAINSQIPGIACINITACFKIGLLALNRNSKPCTLLTVITSQGGLKDITALKSRALHIGDIMGGILQAITCCHHAAHAGVISIAHLYFPSLLHSHRAVFS